MAEGNSNHAELSGSIAGQTLSISTKDVIPVLILLVAGVAGYLVWLALDKRLDSMQQQHVRTIEILIEQTGNVEKRMAAIHQMFAVHDYNSGRPLSEHLPLDLPPGLLPKSLDNPSP